MSENELNDEAALFHRKFKSVHAEIRILHDKVHLQDGWWIFKTHVYTLEELLRSPHHHKISAMTRKLGDDAENWYKVGEISEIGRSAYYAGRENIRDRLQEVEETIRTRKPTWWEGARVAIADFLERVASNMPDLVRTLLERAKLLISLPKPMRKILKLSHTKKKNL